jgi:hypothetical protein
MIQKFINSNDFEGLIDFIAFNIRNAFDINVEYALKTNLTDRLSNRFNDREKFIHEINDMHQKVIKVLKPIQKQFIADCLTNFNENTPRYLHKLLLPDTDKYTMAIINGQNWNEKHCNDNIQILMNSTYETFSDMYIDFEDFLTTITLKISGGILYCDLFKNRHTENQSNQQIKKLVNSCTTQFNTVFLTLRHNNISLLEENDFYGFNNLKILDLSHNMIKTLDGIFWNIPLLESLYLNHNNLRILNKNCFGGLPHLKELHLDHNNLSVIIPGCFLGLKSLEILNLNNNKLTDFSIQHLDGISRLKLFIKNNNLLGKIFSFILINVS